MRKTLILSAITVCLTSAPALASSDDARPRPNAALDTPWMTVSEVADLVTARGLVVHEVEREGYGYEVDAVDADGRRFELRVDPITGTILEQEIDD